MQKTTIIVSAQDGLTNRTATRFIEVANRYKSRLTICRPGHTINAKSLLGVLSLKVKRGDEIELMAAGPDEEKALEALVKFIEEEP